MVSYDLIDLFDFIEPTAKIKSITIDNIYKTVQQEFGISDFFICGGSLLDLQSGRDYKDIDIYFEKEEYFLEANTTLQNSSNCSRIFETDNASTFDTVLGNIQLIKRRFGKPEYIMDGFDINKSRICMTSVGIVLGRDFFDEIHIDYNNIKTDTVSRIFKYIDTKGFKPIEGRFNMLVEILDYISINKYTEFDSYYDNKQQNCIGLELIAIIVRSWDLNKLELDVIFDLIDQVGKINHRDAFLIISKCFVDIRDIYYNHKLSYFIEAYFYILHRDTIDHRVMHICNVADKEKIETEFAQYFI